MRLFKRAEEPAEVPCPNCHVLVSVNALECDVCGWDLRELPPHRPEMSDPPASAR